MNTVKGIDPNIVQIHAALFDTWFPIEQLPIPPVLVNDIAKLAAKVSAAMLEAFSQSAFMPILQGMAYPQSLPFYAGLAQSKNLAAQAFIKVVSQKPANGKVNRTTLSSLPSDVYSYSVQVAALSA